MSINSKAQEIVATTATSAAQDCLNTLPLEVLEGLSPDFLHHLREELQADLQSVTQSRFL